jgi:hypothetical protein
MNLSKLKGRDSSGDSTSSPLQASIVGSCLVSFSSDISVQDQQDIQDCFSYAELAANSRHSVEDSPKAWFDYYQSRMLKSGLKLIAIVPNSPIIVGSSHELTNAAFDVIGSVGSRQMAQLARRTYEALKVDDVAWDYFRGGVVNGGQSIIKFAPCERLSTGEIAVVLFGLRYKTSVFEDDLFFWSDVEKLLTLIPDGGVFIFNGNDFASYREALIEKIVRHTDKIIVKRLKG